MVNLAKRMRGLTPLFHIRHGEGAAVLPPLPSPQLTLLRLRYNRQLWNQKTKPARTFNKEYLPRLKYHNPGLAIRVEDGSGSRLQLSFESPNQEALAALETNFSEDLNNDGVFKETWSEIESESEPRATSKTPSPTPIPKSTFTRHVSLSLAEQQPNDIWKWFQKTTKCEDVPETPEETAEMERLRVLFEKSEEDRQRVKAGIDALRKQQAELKRAREAAERMLSEV